MALSEDRGCIQVRLYSTHVANEWVLGKFSRETTSETALDKHSK